MAQGQGGAAPGRQQVTMGRPRWRAARLPARRTPVLAALSAAGCLLVAACSSGGSPTSAGQPSGTSSAHAVTAASAALSITPANGEHTANPAKGVVVKASEGKIKSVTVTAGHDAVSGTLNKAQTVWRSTWALQPSRNYTVHATAVNSAGKTVNSVSRFRTLTPSATNTAMIFEGYKQSYGVGIPIRLTFSSPVTDKAAVERSLQVTSSKPVTGAWYWDGDETLYFRPMNYWTPGTTVSFDGHLAGLQSSPGVFFTADLTQTFDIGPSLIVVASTKTHYLNVYFKDKLWGHWPISTGRPGLDTVDGTYITLEKGNPVRMVGNGYNELVNDAVRFTYSGDYLHSAPWSVGEQGYSNVSHGCVNLSPEHAAMYYNLATPGDPVTIIGSPKAGKWDDGFTVWFLSWKQLLKGSALGMAVQAGPSGSTFVSPSTVTEQPQTSRLTGPKPDNSAAQS